MSELPKLKTLAERNAEFDDAKWENRYSRKNLWGFRVGEILRMLSSDEGRFADVESDEWVPPGYGWDAMTCELVAVADPGSDGNPDGRLILVELSDCDELRAEGHRPTPIVFSFAADAAWMVERFPSPIEGSTTAWVCQPCFDAMGIQEEPALGGIHSQPCERCGSGPRERCTWLQGRAAALWDAQK